MDPDNDHHAFHEDAQPGDLGPQFGTTHFRSSNQLPNQSRLGLCRQGSARAVPTGYASVLGRPHRTTAGFVHPQPELRPPVAPGGPLQPQLCYLRYSLSNLNNTYP